MKVSNETQVAPARVSSNPRTKLPLTHSKTGSSVQPPPDPLAALLARRPSASRRDAFGLGQKGPPQPPLKGPSPVVVAQGDLDRLLAQGTPVRSDYQPGASGTAEYNMGRADYQVAVGHARARLEYEQLRQSEPRRENYPDPASFAQEHQAWHERLVAAEAAAGFAPAQKKGD